MEAVRLPNGQYAESEEKCLKLLLKTHYPGFWEEEEICPRSKKWRSTKTSWEMARKIFTPEKVRWAVANLAPYKAPGVDGIYPVLLQEEIELLIGSLTNMFRPFLALGHVPEVWKIVRAVFIPKGRRPSHVGIKDYRPISLTSFILKTMGTCIDWFIKDEVLRRNPFHFNQYAYREGVSAETALNVFVSRIEAQLERGNYAVAVFMDVKVAFSHTSSHIICKEAASRGAPRPIVDWMMDLLGTRRINSTLGSYRCSGAVSMGTLQGGVTSPLDWSRVGGIYKETQGSDFHAALTWVGRNYTERD